MPEKRPPTAVRLAVDDLAATAVKPIWIKSNCGFLAFAVGGGAMAAVGVQRWLSRVLGDDLAALFLVMIVLVMAFGLAAPRSGGTRRR
jgi:hypothetical protein